ncbi:beta-mannosidase-like [Daphnia pulex]|uniref:beta-mannosidase-like n=1 Tax=Daphnia pulex TaxID=6669 RepID=UPI001EDED826|nr:beta-mannosidase-like [Daphnia pulex]
MTMKQMVCASYWTPFWMLILPLCYCHLMPGDTFRPSVVSAENVRLDLTTANGYQWRTSLPNGSLVVEGQVPGGIYTDLERAGVLRSGPLLYRFNDGNYRWIAFNDWNYALDFDVDSNLVNQPGVFLVLHGVDTIAEISLNRLFLGETDNMFVRYRFNVRNLLKAQGNQLRVQFRSPVAVSRNRYEQQLMDYIVPPRCVPPEYQGECHANFIRKMQASFSWDWGPAFPSMGLWKAVSLEAYQSITLRDVYVETSLNGSDWQVDLLMHCETADIGVSHSGTWAIRIFDNEDVLLHELIDDSLVSGDQEREATVRFQLRIGADQIEPWMPNGYGNPTLYNLSVSYSENEQVAIAKNLLIGFRTVVLVEDDLQTGGRTFYLQVNDVPIFLKGSNWIPADVLPELVTPEYIRDLLTSCVDANMNSLRVWGGGIYELDEFYQTADELGILVWQDFMFACSMYPTTSWFLESVSIEVVQQVRRLQAHPSVVLWAGNNENEAALRGNWYGTLSDFNLYRQDYIKLYVDTIREIVRREDPSRPFVVSSPSNGKLSEEEGHIARDPYSELYGDVHYYNYYSNGWNSSSFPKPRMSTEYGFQALPSVHSWATVADPSNDDDWSFNGALLSNRQHHPLGNFEMELQVSSRFGLPKTNLSTRRGLEDMIYLTQMHQAQAIKTQTLHYRRHKYQLSENGAGLTMAALYWQLNDIWQAPSWASIEYGGRWKPLHYFAVDFFAPFLCILTELDDGTVAAFVHFDRRQDLVSGILTVSLRSWDLLDPLASFSSPVNQDMLAGEPVWIRSLNELLNETGCTRETCFITSAFFDTTTGQESIAPPNYLFLTSFPNVGNLQMASVEVVDVSKVYVTQRSEWTVNITLATDNVAAFVWIDSGTYCGTFSTNGFMFYDRFKTVKFYSKTEIVDIGNFKNNLNLIHLAQIIL